MREFLERKIGDLRQPRIYRSLAALVLIAAGTYFFTEILVTLALVVAVGVVSWTVKQLEMKQIGVELATLSTVLIGAAYGPTPGAIMGLGLILLQITAGQYTGGYIVWVIPAYPVAGFLAGTFQGTGIFILGSSLVIGMQAFFALMTAVTPTGMLSKYAPYAVTNVLFNLFVFRYVAPVLLPLMA